MTDNVSVYKSRTYRDLLVGLGIKRKRTKPYTRRAAGKAGRFIQTGLREWAELANVRARKRVESPQSAMPTPTRAPLRARKPSPGSPNATPPAATAVSMDLRRPLG